MQYRRNAESKRDLKQRIVVRMNESSVHGFIGPSTGDMSILANIGSYHRLSVVVKPVYTAEAEGRVEIPGEFAGAEGAGQIQLPLVAVVNGSPNPSAFEVLENASEEAIHPLLLLVFATRPVANVQDIVAELPPEQLAPLLPAQATAPRRQVRLPRPRHLPLLARAIRNDTRAHRLRQPRRLRLCRHVERVVV